MVIRTLASGLPGGGWVSRSKLMRAAEMEAPSLSVIVPAMVPGVSWELGAAGSSELMECSSVGGWETPEGTSVSKTRMSNRRGRRRWQAAERSPEPEPTHTRLVERFSCFILVVKAGSNAKLRVVLPGLIHRMPTAWIEGMRSASVAQVGSNCGFAEGVWGRKH